MLHQGRLQVFLSCLLLETKQTSVFRFKTVPKRGFFILRYSMWFHGSAGLLCFFPLHPLYANFIV